MKQPRKSFFHVLFAATVIVVSVGAIQAQTVTGTLQGTVIDSRSANVSGAQVVARNVETGQERTMTTNSDGFYSAPFLPIGTYTVTASGQGFATAVQKRLVQNRWHGHGDHSCPPSFSATELAKAVSRCKIPSLDHRDSPWVWQGDHRWRCTRSSTFWPSATR